MTNNQKSTLWACYWETRHGDRGISLHHDEGDALFSCGEMIDVGDMTEREAEEFWALADTNVDKFRTRFYELLEYTGHEVLVQEVELP
jgi:hypothetical protein